MSHGCGMCCICNDRAIYRPVFGVVHTETAWERVVFSESSKQPGGTWHNEVITDETVRQLVEVLLCVCITCVYVKVCVSV